LYVGYFLRERIAFIRQFYDTASTPFIKKKSKIEAGEDPFVPPYSEDGEPPFLAEWIEADDSLHVLGYSCVSMIAASLHLYLRSWESEFRVPVSESLRATFKKDGWFNGYRAYFETHTGIHFDQSTIDLSLLEEIVLARNRVQHPESITKQRTHYSSSDIQKLRRPFLVDEQERKLLIETDETPGSWLFPPNVHITKEKLDVITEAVEKFSDWLESQIASRVYQR
jgi:hypothetical protein